MNLAKGAYPHPVLGIGESILDHNINTRHSLVEEENSYELKIECNYENDDIKSLVETGKAAYLCEATCSATLYRKATVYNSPFFTFIVDRKEVRGHVDLLVKVIATVDIEKYTNSKASPLFQYMGPCYVQKGDILAVLYEDGFEADIQYEKLKAVSQIFVVTGDYSGNTINVDLSRDKIEVQMPASMYSLFADPSINRNPLYAPLFHASIVQNALVKALREMDNNRDKVWAKTIRHRLETEEEFKSIPIDEDNYSKISQLLLNNPYDSMLKAIKKIDDDSRNR